MASKERDFLERLERSRMRDIRRIAASTPRRVERERDFFDRVEDFLGSKEGIALSFVPQASIPVGLAETTIGLRNRSIPQTGLGLLGLLPVVGGLAKKAASTGPVARFVTRETVRPTTAAALEKGLLESGRATIRTRPNGSKVWIETTDHPDFVNIYDDEVGGFVTDAFRSNLDDLVDSYSYQRKVIPEPEIAPNSLIEIDDDLLRTAAESTRKAPLEATSDIELMLMGKPSKMDKLVWAAGEGDETAVQILRDVRRAYDPVRTALKDRFGETVTLYRYTDPEIEALYDNKPTQLFTSERMARNFAYEGRRADAVEVRVDDIIAAPSKDKVDNGYHEFIVDIRGLGR